MRFVSTMPSVATPLLALVAFGGLSACADRELPEDWRPWFDDGAPLDPTEAIAFTDAAYDFPADTSKGIAAMRDEVIDHTFSNDGPLVSQADFHSGESGCTYWESTSELPRTVTGIVTSHPRVYKKIEGCVGDEKYYGSFWMEDATGAIFVLRDSKVAEFDVGARITMNVRSVRRRYDIDMVYVYDPVEIDEGPYPVSYRVVDRPLTDADQSQTVRASGVVVTDPTTFGETLLQLDGWEGTCSGDDEITRGQCLYVLLDQELGRRGVTLHIGDHVEVTGPVGQSAYFADSGVFNYYGVYVTKLGQVTFLD
ncbi:MAG: hypothetical protein H6733_13355 [Alphaproteobacteria bacterium]|nr:hypothetical protein [Alphaproteobacteria bacterium]